MNHFFQFETDFVESLRCIPMQVRLKLDTCGVKLKLAHWHQLTSAERQQFVEQPCATAAEVRAYRQDLQALVTERSGRPAGELAIDPHPPWLEASNIPEEVKLKAAEFDKILTVEEWSRLTPEQRFALIKLSRSSHENKNFLPALQEFKLIG